MKRQIVIYLQLLITLGTFAQGDRQAVRTGNRWFHKQDFAKAEAEYRKALAANPRNPQAMYNLGCALMLQQKDSAAIEQYKQAGKLETSKIRKAMIYHNIGTVCQKHQMYGEAIEAYKESLRNHPEDHETRYNLALCKRLLKNQPQQQGGGSKDQKKQDQNQDKKGPKDQKNKQQPKDQGKDSAEKMKQPQEKMSRENAEQLLNAAMQEERATQQRLQKDMQHQRSRRLQKNW